MHFFIVVLHNEMSLNKFKVGAVADQLAFVHQLNQIICRLENDFQQIKQKNPTVE